MADQPGAPELSIESRMAAVFGGGETPAKAAAPAPEPAQEQDAPSDQPALDAALGAQSQEGDEQDQEATSQPDTVEIDWEDGQRYAIPAPLKDAFLKESDYRRKTMELAEIRKSAEADRFTLNANAAFQQQVSPLMQKRAELAATKERARTLDWTQLTTDQKIDIDRELRNIDQQIADIDGRVAAGYQQHQQAIGQAVLHAVGATEQYMTHKVPGWSNVTGQQLHDYGLSLGIPKAKLTTGWFADPVATEVMYKAQQWDKLQAGKPQVANRAANAPPAVKPGSSAARPSEQRNRYQQVRERLRKTGSLEDAAAALFMQRSK